MNTEQLDEIADAIVQIKSAAAKWLGMSRTTLVAAVEGRKDIAAETVALVRAEYPELFGGKVKK